MMVDISIQKTPEEQPMVGQTAVIKVETSSDVVLDKKMHRIGDRLVEQGLISVDQLNVALHEKRKSGKMVGQVLVELSFISEATLATFLAETTGYQQFDPKKTMLDPEA